MSVGDRGISMTGTGGFELIVCPCNTISDFPERCPWHSPPVETQTYTWTGTQLRLTTPTLPRLSDEDVQRIAREVVRQMARADHDPGDEC